MKGHQPQILNLIDPSNTYTKDRIEIGRVGIYQQRIGGEEGEEC